MINPDEWIEGYGGIEGWGGGVVGEGARDIWVITGVEGTAL